MASWKYSGYSIRRRFYTNYCMGYESDTSWHWLLELKLRRTIGNNFQSFFSDVMEARYGENFVRIKPYGKLGDSGCDGYLQSDGSVYACYGAQNDAAGSAAGIISKMKDDFAKVLEKLPDIMNSWHMTHNIVEGLPIEALALKKSFEEKHCEVSFHFFGRPKFVEILDALTEDQRITFLGAYARNSDYIELSPVRSYLTELVVNK